MANNRPERYTNLIHARVPQDGSRTVIDYRFFYDDPRRYGLTQDPSGIGVPTPGENAAGASPVSYAYPPGHVFRYMTETQRSDVLARTLTQPVRVPCQTAIDVAKASEGVEAYFPAGAYLIDPDLAHISPDGVPNGLVVTYGNWQAYSSQVSIRGDGQSTVLMSGANNMALIRWSDANGRIDNLSLDANAKTGCYGLALWSSNTVGASVAEFIDWNVYTRLSIYGFDNGVVMQSPSAGGTYYNRFFSIRFYNNIRAVWLQDNNPARGANRNTFYSCNVNNGNCGFYIDGADTTQIISCTFEGISQGTSPLATPAAIYINSVGIVSGANTENTNIVACITESCTRDLDCSNRRTSIIGGTIGNVASTTGSAYPDIWLGGDHTLTLRELGIGDPSSADSFIMKNRLTTYGSPRLCTSANAGGSFPFDNDGSILIQAREQTASGIQLAVGVSSAQGIDILGDGSVAIRSNSRRVDRIGAAAYSASITLDATTGNLFEIVANNGTAFAINAPSNPKAGQIITIVIFNTSGGALGAVTWNAIFKLSAWTQPANGNNRAISFYYGGTAWREIMRTTVDVTN